MKLADNIASAATPVAPVAPATIASVLGALYYSDWDLWQYGSSYTLGTGVASVANLGSCPAAVIQVTGSRQPSLQLWGFTSNAELLRAARFDGSNDSLMATLAPVIPSGSRSYFWVAVAGVPSSQPSNRYIAALQDLTYANGSAAVSTVAVADKFSGSHNNSVGSDTQDTGVSIGVAKHLVEVAHTPGMVACIVVDGVPFNGVTERVPTADITRMVVGSCFYSGLPYGPSNVDVGQVVVATGLPSAAQILAVRSLLRTKWGTL